ncbi:MAG: 16S rRNA (adenine(1518)-N(6)/adenine(1519)-N(6))-dimethyltransferase RsmA [Fusobacteriota bacterium]
MFKHKKKYGQNFLNNPRILDKIMEVSNVDNDCILEIGPGKGALTQRLLERAKKVNCVEIDNTLEKILSNKFGDKSNFNLIMGDILEIDLKKHLSSKNKVVANIPYYITSPIIQKLIANEDIIDEIYIMVQKEVAERISAKPGTKARSVLTFSIEYFAEATYLFDIPREDFTPAPNVDSAFLKIILRRDNKYQDLIDEKLFFKYVKAGFMTKRKNIVNNLYRLGHDKKELRKLLKDNGISPKKRAEEFSIDEYIEMIKLIENKNKK